MPENERRLFMLDAIGVVDGRYATKVDELRPFASEGALIRTRVEVESKYLIALSEAGLVRSLSDQEHELLEGLGTGLSDAQVLRVKDIEEETRHDVKAVEREMREVLSETSLNDVVEMIHFGLTSEDVNNLSYRLMLKRALGEVCVPALDSVVDSLAGMAEDHKGLVMLGRTHGQGAVPTTLGKEMANFAVRLNGQVRALAARPITGKVNGAVGNYNAHELAAPEIDWIGFSRKFVESLGLEPNLFTTQINPYEDVIGVLHALEAVNGVVIDLDQDVWRYISDGWLIQAVKKGEVGSSTMPQKVNPIDVENAEGNVTMGRGVFGEMVKKLSASRLQRDLSDSTVVRNVGLGLAYGLLAWKSTLNGLGKVRPDKEAIAGALNENWAILTEGVQTVLRRAGVEDPYSLVAELVRGKKIDQKAWKEWVGGLPIDKELKSQLAGLTPETYIGYAPTLTEMAIEEIKRSRGG